MHCLGRRFHHERHPVGRTPNHPCFVGRARCARLLGVENLVRRGISSAPMQPTRMLAGARIWVFTHCFGTIKMFLPMRINNYGSRRRGVGCLHNTEAIHEQPERSWNYRADI